MNIVCRAGSPAAFRGTVTPGKRAEIAAWGGVQRGVAKREQHNYQMLSRCSRARSDGRDWARPGFHRRQDAGPAVRVRLFGLPPFARRARQEVQYRLADRLPAGALHDQAGDRGVARQIRHGICGGAPGRHHLADRRGREIAGRQASQRRVERRREEAARKASRAPPRTRSTCRCRNRRPSRPAAGEAAVRPPASVPANARQGTQPQRRARGRSRPASPMHVRPTPLRRPHRRRRTADRGSRGATGCRSGGAATAPIPLRASTITRYRERARRRPPPRSRSRRRQIASSYRRRGGTYAAAGGDRRADGRRDRDRQHAGARDCGSGHRGEACRRCGEILASAPEK